MYGGFALLDHSLLVQTLTGLTGSDPPPPPTMTSTTIRRAISMHRQQPLEGFLAPEDREN